jgi:N6-L-threonylcarbamoyladenine synthase
MVNHPSLDTSFSGIKTALAQALQRRAASHEDGPSDADLAAAYEVAIVETIAASVRKLLKARGTHSGHQQARQKLALVGGVAANERLRSKLAEICSEYDVESVATPLQWCGDNAAMIGVAASWGVELDALSARQLDAFATSPLFRDSTKVPN